MNEEMMQFTPWPITISEAPNLFLRLNNEWGRVT